MRPGGANFVNGSTHAERVDFGRGCQRTDGHGNVVAPAARVNHVGKEKCAALVFGHASQELPTNQRMQFRIFIDWLVDTNEQAIRFQGRQMSLKIEAWSAHARYFQKNTRITARMAVTTSCRICHGRQMRKISPSLPFTLASDAA